MRFFRAIPGASSAQTCWLSYFHIVQRMMLHICPESTQAPAVERAPLCRVLCGHGRAVWTECLAGDFPVTSSLCSRRQKGRMRKQHPLCHQDQQIWTKSCARSPARISLSTVKVWMLVETMRSCQSLLTTVIVPVLTMRSCQRPWESQMPYMTMEEMEVTTMRRSFLRSPARGSATQVSTNGRAHVLGSFCLSTHLTKCVGQTPEPFAS